MKHNGNFQICDYAQVTVIITVKLPPESLQSAAVINSFSIYGTIYSLDFFTGCLWNPSFNDSSYPHYSLILKWSLCLKEIRLTYCKDKARGKICWVWSCLNWFYSSTLEGLISNSSWSKKDTKCTCLCCQPHVGSQCCCLGIRIPLQSSWILALDVIRKLSHDSLTTVLKMIVQLEKKQIQIITCF